MGLMNTLVVEIHKMYKMYETDTVNNLHYFVIIYSIFILKILYIINNISFIYIIPFVYFNN